MAVTAATAHFVQVGDAPVFIGTGVGTLACTCGRALIERYAPDRFVGIAIACGACGAVTETPALPAGTMPPTPVVVADAASESSSFATAVASSAALIGRAEMDRITGLYRPRTPTNNVYAISGAFLDETASIFERLTGGGLPAVSTDFAEGLAQHALAWSIQHLRERLRSDAWACLEDPASSVASVTVTGFRHFEATWSHHPLFPAMVATAADRGFSAHGLALFAAAHGLLQQNNRVGFPTPSETAGRINYVRLATGPSQSIPVMVKVFDQFEVPWGRPWTPDNLRVAAQEAIESEQGRINPRNPGMLLLSPGTAMAGFDEALIRAVQAAMQAVGRRHRGLTAVGLIVLRLLPGPDAHAVQFGFGLFPVKNRHYRGEIGLS
ncbi:MAG TPA: hypothetical protein VFG62_08165 [Rhodopila sp.]|nr:hypothetical protein [Rhodopila sp.]